MTDRFSKVGIQRELHMAWFDQAVRIYGSGLSKAESRLAIYGYLDDAPGFSNPPTQQSKTYIANVLIKSWIAPDPEIIQLRDLAYLLIQECPSNRLAIHWCLLGAAYPFWLGVASKVGRLLNLQDQFTQAQIVLRLKENYGDRQTVSRRARYVIRSYVSWGVLIDSTVKGCYERNGAVPITDLSLAIYIITALLRANKSRKSSLGELLNHTALFPFQLPIINGDYISQHSDMLQVERYGGGDELLMIK